MSHEDYRVVVGTTLDALPFIALGGEIDLAAVPALREALGAIKDLATATGVAVALSEVTFMDSGCLRWLIDLRSELGDGKLWLVSPSRPVRTVLNVTGLADTFTVIDDLAEIAPRPDRAPPH